jgi:hypothetical protein
MVTDSENVSGSRWSRIVAVFSAPSGILFLTLVITYAYFPPTSGWNENSRFDLTRAVVEEGRLRIDSFHMNTSDKARCGDHHCTDKAPGASFVGALPHAGYYLYLRLRGLPLPKTRVLFTSAQRAQEQRLGAQDKVLVNSTYHTALYVVGLFTSAIPGALAVILLVHLCLLLGAPRLPAFGVGAIYGLGTMAFPYSTSFYGHQLAATALLAAFVLVEHGRRAERSSRQRWLTFAGGLLGGIAFAAEYPLAIPAVGLAVYIVALSPPGARVKRVIWFGLGVLLPVLLVMAYLWTAFGSPFLPGYGRLTDPDFARGQGQGLYGVTYPRLGALFGTLFGRFRGLFYVSPVIAMAPVGWILAWRRQPSYRPALLFSAFVVTFFLLLNASYYMWWGGASAGPRHLVPMLPFVVLPMVVLLQDRWWRLPTLALGVVSAANMLALTAAGIKAPELGDILTEYAWPTVLGLSDRPIHIMLGRVLGFPPWLCLILILVFWVLAAVFLVQRLSSKSSQTTDNV